MSTLAVATIKSISSGAPVFQNTSGVEKGQLCKAWINCGNDADINDDFGFSSVTDHGTGLTEFHFSTAMSNANYCVVGAHAQDNRTNPSKFWWVDVDEQGTGSFRTVVNTATGGIANLGKYYCAVFGD